MSEQAEADRFRRLTAQIVVAHVAHNQLDVAEVPSLIETVHKALVSLGKATEEPVRQEPAVPIKKSVFPDYIVCLEDGKKLKMLKRHLATRYNLTPEQYRARWNLPADYPMVAPAYAEKRRELAKKIGLGRKPAPKRGRAKASAA